MPPIDPEGRDGANLDSVGPGSSRRGRCPSRACFERRRAWVAFGGLTSLILIALIVCGFASNWGGLAGQPAASQVASNVAPQAAHTSAVLGRDRPAARSSARVAAASPSGAVTSSGPAVTACSVNSISDKALIVSISRQTLWACEGNQLVNTSRVTTGATNSTPTGTFQIQAKEGPQYLNGCNETGCWHDFVHVWMPFYGDYGFHDATWQTMPFGSAGYTTQGSHGCVHLPLAESYWVYDWASVGTKVTIES